MIGDSMARGIVFGVSVDPLPLVDPTVAARRLGLKRHTLACYRNLGDGPAYYRFGRAIRYALADLDAWSARSAAIAALPMRPSEDLLLIDTAAAARFLTTSVDYLKYHRVVGGGPPYRRFGRSIHYAVDGLFRWAERQRYPGRAGSIDTFAGGR